METTCQSVFPGERKSLQIREVSLNSQCSDLPLQRAQRQKRVLWKTGAGGYHGEVHTGALPLPQMMESKL